MSNEISGFSIVVNCFQNTNFSEDSQGVLCKQLCRSVVNCFQNTNFSEDSQVGVDACTFDLCCELLSEY